MACRKDVAATAQIGNKFVMIDRGRASCDALVIEITTWRLLECGAGMALSRTSVFVCVCQINILRTISNGMEFMAICTPPLKIFTVSLVGIFV